MAMHKFCIGEIVQVGLLVLLVKMYQCKLSSKFLYDFSGLQKRIRMKLCNLKNNIKGMLMHLRISQHV